MAIYYRENDVEMCINNVYNKWLDPEMLESDEDRETLKEMLTDVLRELDKIRPYYA